MECNKDEALRAKEVAESKFAEKDYNGAKKFAQKAKQMYPGLDFISLFITIVDIYCSRERMVDGQPDWNGVLRVEPSADFETKCESYWKLALEIQADRNNVVGAEGAFQILSEAWCMLSDTFWTKCSRCRFNFQYFQSTLNKKIACKNCGECFRAVPLPSGNHPMGQRPMSCLSQSQDTSHHGAEVVLALGSASSSHAGGKGACKHSKRMKKDDGESSNKVAKVEGHEAGLVPGVGSAPANCVDSKGTLQHNKMAGKDAMKLSSSEI